MKNLDVVAMKVLFIALAFGLASCEADPDCYKGAFLECRTQNSEHSAKDYLKCIVLSEMQCDPKHPFLVPGVDVSCMVRNTAQCLDRATNITEQSSSRCALISR